MFPKWIETENETRGRWIERHKSRLGLYHSSHFHHFCIWVACSYSKETIFLLCYWYLYLVQFSMSSVIPLTISLPFNFCHAMLSKFKRHASSCIDHIYWVKRKNIRRFVTLQLHEKDFHIDYSFCFVLSLTCAFVVYK